VQVFGLDLLDGMDYDGVSALIENMTSKYGDMSVIKASIELHEHKTRTVSRYAAGARTDSAGD